MNFFDNLFNPHECIKIIELGIKQGLEPAMMNSKKNGGDYQDNSNRSTLRSFLYPTTKSIWIYKRIHDISTTPMIFERIQFLKYQSGDHFDWHQDWGLGNPRINARRFSWTILLNDPDEYSGCDLWIQEQDKIKQAPRIQGCGIRFLSKDIHKVTHCIDGTRYALTAWQLDPSSEAFVFNKGQMYLDKEASA